MHKISIFILIFLFLRIYLNKRYTYEKSLKITGITLLTLLFY